MIAAYARLRYLARRLSWHWPAALFLLVLAAGFLVAVVHPTRQTLQALESRHARQSPQQPGGKSRAAGGPLRVFAGFYARFPEPESVADWLGVVQATAKANQVELPQGEYRLVRAKSGKFAEYRMTLPLKGQYPAIRAFITSALAQVPAMMLENVSFERQKIGDTTVLATVHLTLYLRDGK